MLLTATRSALVALRSIGVASIWVTSRRCASSTASRTGRSSSVTRGCALADGLPIATGVIEGACRYLVSDRMGRTGAVWSIEGAEAVLRLRALRASGDFDDYWQFHLVKEHERTHRVRYAAGEVPNPLPPKRPHLRLVK